MAICFFFRENAARRRAFDAAPGSAERSCLYGMDQFAARGLPVRHNFECARRPFSAAGVAGLLVSRLWRAATGYPGDFATVLEHRGAAGSCDAILATVDTVGIPLLALRRCGLLRRPVIMVSMGLPERLAALRHAWARELHRRLLRGAAAVVAYGHGEADELREWLRPQDGAPPVLFVPFAVDTAHFAPDPDAPVELDILSLGFDPNRDYSLLVDLLRAHPGLRGRIITDVAHLRVLGEAPANLRAEPGLPFAGIRGALAGARVVVLPVRQNGYSGATTTLLQAMSMARPVVVSATHAIAHGYHLEDGVNCRLVPPGDAPAFERATLELLADPAGARRMGLRARETVLRHHAWERYVHDLLALFGRHAPSGLS